MTRALLACVLTVWASCMVGTVYGHGRLVQPPARATMWRYGFHTPVNYNDHQLNCGGFAYQQKLGYKCGVCGDPWDSARENESGGRYAKGVISARYKANSVITARVQITANHKGWFQFKICPNNDINKAATHACFDKYPLVLAKGNGTRYHLPDTSDRTYSVELRLPACLTCKQCVLQWRYHTGNSWGVDVGSQTGCVGCGEQEEFYGCADVAISDNDGKYTTQITEKPAVSKTTEVISNRTKIATQYVTTTTPSTEAPPGGDKGKLCRGVEPYKSEAMDRWCINNCPDNCPSSHCECKISTGVWPARKARKTCRGVGSFAKRGDKWCERNCNHSPAFCPRSFCECMHGDGKWPARNLHKVCRGVGTFANHGDRWCQQNCNHVPPYCPATHCECR